MKVKIEIDEVQLKKLIVQHIAKELGTEVDEKEIDFLVKTKSNYKADWEHGKFQAICEFKRDAN